jgi:serine/threonine protein kinase
MSNKNDDIDIEEDVTVGYDSVTNPVSIPIDRKLWVVKDDVFELEQKYEVKDYLGAGAYGIVCSALNSETKHPVAIKKCKKVLQSRTMAKRMLRELRILRFLDNIHVIKILSIQKPYIRDSFMELYIVFEHMETDLAQIIRSSQVLREEHIEVKEKFYIKLDSLV